MIKKLFSNIFTIKGLKSISSMASANVIGNLISGLFWLYLANLLGAESYGEISYFLAIGSIASAISVIGGTYSMIVFSAKKVNIQPAIYLISFISSIISAIAVFIISENYAISIYVIGYTTFNLALNEYVGLKLYKIWSRNYIIQKILFVVLAYLLYLILGPPGIILGLGLSFFPFFQRIFFHSKQSFSSSYEIFKSKIGFVLNSQAIDFSGILKSQLSNIIIAPMFGFAILGNYFLTIQILSFLAIIPGSIFRFTLSEDSSGEQTKTVKIFGMIITVCLAIFGAFVTPLIVEIIFPEYTEFSELMQIMSFTLIPASLGLMFLSKILAKEKSKHALISNIIFVGFFVIGIFTLGDKFEISGIAFSFLLASCFSTIYLGIILKKIRT